MLTHAQLASILSLFSRHPSAMWLPFKRSDLDAKLLRRLTGLDVFVSFEASDHVARGTLLRGATALGKQLEQRFVMLVHAHLAAGPVDKRARWLSGERESAWRGAALAARGLAGWGAVLQAERTSLRTASTPGIGLMMLQAVRTKLFVRRFHARLHSTPSCSCSA